MFLYYTALKKLIEIVLEAIILSHKVNQCLD